MSILVPRDVMLFIFYGHCYEYSRYGEACTVTNARSLSLDPVPNITVQDICLLNLSLHNSLLTGCDYFIWVRRLTRGITFKRERSSQLRFQTKGRDNNQTRLKLSTSSFCKNLSFQENIKGRKYFH